jgi:hypothetical protein
MRAITLSPFHAMRFHAAESIGRRQEINEGPGRLSLRGVGEDRRG